MNDRYELKHGGYLRLATDEERASLNTVLFEVTFFTQAGQFQDTVFFVLENADRVHLSLVRRIELDKTEYIHIYEDVQDMLKNRTFYKDSIVTANCTEYYPVLLFPESIKKGK